MTALLPDILRKNTHLLLSAALFLAGTLSAFLSIDYRVMAGALFGAGASLLGAWVTEFNNRSSLIKEKRQRELDARRYLAPELNRTIERILYIHERAAPNFISASVEHEIKPNYLQHDFIPYIPALYPNAVQFRDLSSEYAISLVSFYDSLHDLEKFIADWWGRDGQLPHCAKDKVMRSSFPAEVQALASHLRPAHGNIRNWLRPLQMPSGRASPHLDSVRDQSRYTVHAPTWQQCYWLLQLPGHLHSLRAPAPVHSRPLCPFRHYYPRRRSSRYLRR